MKCSRCETDLPDSTTICPQCGSTPYQNGQAPFSYLPAGVPPWPTTVPQHLSSMTKAASAEAESFQGVVSGAGQKRSMLSGLATLGILLLIPLLGAMFTIALQYINGGPPAKNVTHAQASSPQQSPTNKANLLPTPTSFKKANSSSVNAVLQYPADWVEEGPKIASDKSYTYLVIRQPQLAISFAFYRFSDTSSSTIKNAEEINQTNISDVGAAQGVSNMQSAPSSVQNPMIAGTQWVQQDVTFVDNNLGAKMHFTSLAVQRSKVYYNIAVFMPDVFHDEATQKYIQPMLDSLQFIA